MAALKAVFLGVSLQEVCDAVGWFSPHTFVRFYNLNLVSTRGCLCPRFVFAMIHTRTGTTQYGVGGIIVPIASTSDAV